MLWTALHQREYRLVLGRLRLMKGLTVECRAEVEGMRMVLPETAARFTKQCCEG